MGNIAFCDVCGTFELDRLHEVGIYSFPVMKGREKTWPGAAVVSIEMCSECASKAISDFEEQIEMAREHNKKSILRDLRESQR